MRTFVSDLSINETKCRVGNQFELFFKQMLESQAG